MEALPTAPRRRQVSVDASLLLYALRYALGRSSYAVGEVADAIVGCAATIDVATLMNMARDINEHLLAVQRGLVLAEPADITATWEALLDVVLASARMQVDEMERT